MRNLAYYAMATVKLKCRTPEENQIRLEKLKIGPLTLDKYVPTGNKHYKFDIHTPQPRIMAKAGTRQPQ